MRAIKHIAFGVLSLVVVGCSAKPMDVPDGESIVSLQAQMGDEIFARRLNGQRVTTLDYFKVSPGEHEMEVGIVKMGYQQSHRRCIATFAYAKFLSGQHYKLIERSTGKDVQLILVDSLNNPLAHSDDVHCL